MFSSTQSDQPRTEFDSKISSNPGNLFGVPNEPPGTSSGKNQAKDKYDPAKNQSPLPSVTLPKGGGAIRDIGEKFAVDAVTGTASLSIPIPTSSNRSGLDLNLTLAYDSGAGNGPFGFGWRMQLPFITRKTDKGLPRYWDEQESDTFILSGAEDLVPLLEYTLNGEWIRVPRIEYQSGKEYQVVQYKPRVESGFARIERWTHITTGGTHWRTISRENVTTLYGEDSNSTVFDPCQHDGSPPRIFTWLISSTFDDKGNVMKYEYKAENSEGVDLLKPNELHRTEQTRSPARYPKRIKYGNLTSRLLLQDLSLMHWMFEVVFDYGDHDPITPTISESQPWKIRPDPFSTYRSSFEVRFYRLCRRILMFHNFPDEDIGPDYLVWSLDIVYHEGRTELQKEQDQIASFISSITKSGYVRQGDVYLKDSFPPVECEYSPAVVSHQVRDIDLSNLKNLPGGIDDAIYRWLDLDGEGISGILAKQRGAYYYTHNLGNGHFGTSKSMQLMPSLTSQSEQWLDLLGDGHHDLVQFEGYAPGFYRRTPQDEWLPFKSFESLPNVTWDKGNMQFIDLTGDGLVDILIANDEVFTWYPSKGEVGFGPAEYWRSPLYDDDGPRLLFQDPNISIYVADMTGDSLNDLVRISNGQICYWPNIGYGRFGSMVTMDNAPWFDHAELFHQNRVRLADVDGSGPTDVIYLSHDGAMLYRNQSGNSWTRAYALHGFPQITNISYVQAIDLLGRGTTCLVWSSDIPSDAERHLRYVDLMSGQKPHLLTSIKNNLGSETRIEYNSSTEFYLKDKLSGRPWATRLAFPVQVVECIQTFDFVNRNLFVTRYAYHHGFFDGVEREFRGFGMVEQWDTEEFAALNESTEFPRPANVDAASHVPPIHTKTWFHNGAFFEERNITRVFQTEYYREPNLSDEEYRAMLLDDTIIPHNVRLEDNRRISLTLSVDERREACRSLKGSQLRQEIYALDGTKVEGMPYKVTESNFTIEMLQPRAMNRYASYYTHPRESIDLLYERKLYEIDGRQLADPRVVHDIILSVDYFGNVLYSASIAYGRRHIVPSDILSAKDHEKQKVTQLTYTENSYTNGVFTPEVHRTPLIADSATYQLFNTHPSSNVLYFTNLYRLPDIYQEIELVSNGNYDLPFQDFQGLSAVDGHAYRRLTKRQRTLYRRDDLTGSLPLGRLESLALPYETYRQAFDSTLPQIYIDAGKLSSENLGEVMRASGGYAEFDDSWWIASGKIFYSPIISDSPAQELGFARSHFFIPRRYRNPFYTNTFDTESFIEYDKYNLLVQETRDALGNRVTVGERNINPFLPLVAYGQDYRVLKPVLVMDPNRNRNVVTYDVLGLLVGTAVMGKPGERLGDSLDGFDPYLSSEVISRHFKEPLSDLHQLLGNATTRYVYDHSAYYLRSSPTALSTLTRETHVSDLEPNEKTRVMLDFSYFDGWQGRVIQRKIFAGHGPVDARYSNKNEDRYVCSGWKIFDNKGNSVREYEPFYTTSHAFEFDVRIGVSPTFFYDPVNRLVSTLFPDQTWSKSVFDPWFREDWDGCDTVLQIPTADPDVGDFFRRFAKSDHFVTWYKLRIDGNLGREQQEAVRKASVFAKTPRRLYFDALAHPFLSVDQNRSKFHENNEFYRTLTLFDIDGNEREITDAKGRKAMILDVSMVGSVIHRVSMEAGERWNLDDVQDMNIFTWDSRNQQIRSVYDQLRRVIESYLQIESASEILVERTVYGESLSDATCQNTRGEIVKIHDQAGITTTDHYDFKGNVLRSQRKFSVEYKCYLDWSTRVILEPTLYTTAMAYDALNRIERTTSPDKSVSRYFYNEWGQLKSITTNLQGSTAVTPMVSEIEYNARAQRLLVEYGNDVKSYFEYDPLTFRVARILTRRNPHTFPSDSLHPPKKGWPGCQIQDLQYTYDAVGNITEIRDMAQQAIFFRNKRVSPTNEYTYDAIYRVIKATGREHLGQIDGQRVPVPSTALDRSRTRLDQAADGNAMGRYYETYTYDSVGNTLSIRHERSDEMHAGWTLFCYYSEPSQIEPQKVNNRLSTTSVGNSGHEYHYEGGAGTLGNMTTMPQLSFMDWNYKNQLHSTAQQSVANGGIPETTYYSYDVSGVRVRKVTERFAAVGMEPTRLRERAYLGAFETFSKFDNKGAVVLERQTLQITGQKDRFALIETQTQGAKLFQLFRYQFGDHLGSTKLELDEQAQVISYEEYTPYGSSSFQAMWGQTEAPKRYRYAAKERDQENGLYYYGKRYYACWLSRWTSCDPAGLKDGTNLYEFVRSNPIRNVDLSGTQAEPPPNGAPRPSPTGEPATPPPPETAKPSTQTPNSCTDQIPTSTPETAESSTQAPNSSNSQIPTSSATGSPSTSAAELTCQDTNKLSMTCDDFTDYMETCGAFDPNDLSNNPGEGGYFELKYDHPWTLGPPVSTPGNESGEVCITERAQVNFRITRLWSDTIHYTVSGPLANPVACKAEVNKHLDELKRHEEAHKQAVRQIFAKVNIEWRNRLIKGCGPTKQDAQSDLEKNLNQAIDETKKRIDNVTKIEPPQARPIDCNKCLPPIQ